MESDEKSDPVEPLFKYLRLACDLKKIVENSSISCIFCTEKVVVVGTSWGDLHILDHEGNVNSHQKFPKHIVSINQISVDLKGEYIATCSDDGQVSPIGICATFELIWVSLSGPHQLFVRRRERSSQAREANQVHRAGSDVPQVEPGKAIHHRRLSADALREDFSQRPEVDNSKRIRRPCQCNQMERPVRCLGEWTRRESLRSLREVFTWPHQMGRAAKWKVGRFSLQLAMVQCVDLADRMGRNNQNLCDKKAELG
jgi:hypothetical protein